MAGETTAPWGLNSDNRPKGAAEAATDIIERAVRDYIRTHLDIAECVGLDAATLKHIRHLSLAEPWLPAVRAFNELDASGLISYEHAPQT